MKELEGHWFINKGVPAAVATPIHAYVIKYLGTDGEDHRFDVIEFYERTNSVGFHHSLIRVDRWAPHKPTDADLRKAVVAVFK